jgi:2',3'-cyclic-nucleotide 2'-phosphodiesterase/3'-nucleotidase
MILLRKPLSYAVMLGALMLSGVANANTLHLRVVETTDLHTNMMDHDYYKDQPTEKIGLVRTATLVKQAQQEVINSVLVDNGDLLQGSPMGDYMANKGIKKDDVHPVYKAMNQLNYDAANIGNHEFNYGLPFLFESINDANFPYVSANVIDVKTGKPLFQPYVIKSHQFKDTNGKTHTVNVGYIGFVPPQILIWDKHNLEGKVTAMDIKAAAEKYVPKMKAAGADVIIAIPHSGVSADPHKAMAENSVYYLTQVNDIDAIAFGHSHAIFPSEEFSALPNTNIETGNINGVPSVMPGRWGDHVGVIDLILKKENGKWNVISGTSEARPIFKDGHSLVKADEKMTASLKQDHKNTLAFVNQPLGKASDVMYSHLALVQDDPTVQIVNMAQKDYVEQFIQGDPDLANIPVLSAAAPFKAGGRGNDPTNFTEVEKGTLSIRNAADLYLYPNTLVALKVKGKDVKEWLECAAGQFNQIDPTDPKQQHLINWSSFRTYNFDVIDGINYTIDVTIPARYDGECRLIDPESHRIKNVTFKGKAIDNDQPFLIATNNYRAYSGTFAGSGEKNVAFSAPDENRTVLANYIRKMSEKHGSVIPTADNNWKFAPIHTEIPLNIVFETAPSEKAKQFISEKKQYPMTRLGLDKIGFARYQIDLQTQK